MAGMEVPAIFVGRSLFLILGLPRFVVANGRSSPLAADPNSADSLPVQAGMKIGMQPHPMSGGARYSNPLLT